MKSWTIHDAYQEFSKRRPDLDRMRNSANEAQTRLELINIMLFQVLGWNEREVEVEKHCKNEGFIDYAFTLDHTIPLLVEAKKKGTTFAIHCNQVKEEPIPFSFLADNCPDARSALSQVLGYAVQIGARFVGITNGHQWIIALTFVESESFENRRVQVFDSLDSVMTNFERFWDCFSRDGIRGNRLASRLLEQRIKPAPSRISTAIPGYPRPSKRNVYKNELAYVLDRLWEYFERIEGTSEFIGHCYVATSANQALSEYAREILRERKRRDSEFFVHDIQDAEESVAKVIPAASRQRPFVILGEVGRGKSTFLEHLKWSAGAGELKDYIHLTINFVDRPDTASEVNGFVYYEVEQSLLNDYEIDPNEEKIVKGVLHKDLERYKKSAKYSIVKGDAAKEKEEEIGFISNEINQKHTYFGHLFRHLKYAQRKSIAIFFDNLDRQNLETQEAAFIKASAIARDWDCAVFICLRPDVFHESRRRGILDTVAPKTYTLGTPPLDIVLKRRFEFARKIALGDFKAPILWELKQDMEASMKLPSVAELLGGCMFSVKKGSNSIEALTSLSNGNIRDLLDMTKNVLTGRHLDTRKILDKIRHQGNYSIPDYEVIKTLLYGDYDHYDPNVSVFLNLFDIQNADKKEHFIRLIALDYLSARESRDSRDGFIQLNELTEFLRSFYFSNGVIAWHLKEMTDFRCIDIRGPSEPEGELQHVRILNKGKFHLGTLSSSFQYYDAIMINTPIMDSDVVSAFREEKTIEGRLERTRKFLFYLQDCYKVIHGAPAFSIVEVVLKKALNRLEEIAKGIKKK